MKWMKHCPKCGSTNVNPLAFYRPSIWKCSDCGYEGAFLIECDTFAERIQERHQKRCNITDLVAAKLCMDDLDDPIVHLQKILEDH